MSNKINEEWLIDYLAGELDEEQTRLVEMELSQSETLQKKLEGLKDLMEEVEHLNMVEPPIHMKVAFENILEQEKQALAESPKPKIRLITSWRRIASIAAILGLGILIGAGSQYYFSQPNPTTIADRELEETKQQIKVLVAEKSTSKRIKAVNLSKDLPKIDQEIRDQLIYLMHKDKSSNVRLSAIEALIEIDPSTSTQQALVSALRIEEKPVVQIALIHAIVDLNIDEAIPTLEDLIKKENTLDKVKDEARLGQFKLM